jgi:hypothetical protein
MPKRTSPTAKAMVRRVPCVKSPMIMCITLPIKLMIASVKYEVTVAMCNGKWRKYAKTET